MYIEKEKEIYDDCCIISGSSSSLSILNYAYRVFKRLLFVHSTGGLDKAFSPSCVNGKTYARFETRAPSAHMNTHKSVAKQWSGYTSEGLRNDI